MRSTNETLNATMEPMRLARRSNSALTSCGKSSTKTRSLVKNHSACTLCTFNAIHNAPPPRIATDTRSRAVMRAPERPGHSSRLQQFQLNIDAAESTEELKLDVTAPTIASNPSIATQPGALV